MRRLFTLVVSVIALVVASCSYDDTAVWDKVNSLEDRVAKLEELRKKANSDIEALQAIVEALQQNDYVVSIAPVIEDGKTVGYTITFAKSGEVTIYNGKDGVDGDGNYVPIIGVKKDVDGIYYWTLDGEWLLDESGNKVPAQGETGQDGVTPKLKIENDYWYVSYDNGATWSVVGKATADGNSAINSIFERVEVENDCVIFYLTDGSSFTLPISNQTDGDIIRFLDNAVKVRCVVNWDTDGDNELSKAEAAKVTSLGGVFTECDDIVAFDELRYFTGLTEIEPEAFYDAYNLSKITLPKSIKSIGEWAFTYCERLKQLTIPEGVTKIGYNAFCHCDNLKSITIPGSVEEIQLTYKHYYDDGEFYVEYANPFEDCRSLEAIYSPYASDGRSLIMDNTLIYIASAGINEYTIPAEVKSVANNALGTCDYDYDVVRFPKVVIPESVEYIDYCGLIAAEYHFESMTPPSMHEEALGYWSDYDDNSKPIIYIPDGAYKAYYESDWSQKYRDAIYHEKTKLDTPAPEVAENGDTWFTISWEAVDNADSYTLMVKGRSFNTTETSYKFENYNAGEYIVRVKAIGEGYKDSDFGSVNVTLTGVTSVDWFESSVAPAPVNEEEGYGPYNAVAFTWKGTGVKSLSYGLYISENLIGVADNTIKNALTAVDADTLAAVNSADGFSAVLDSINGGTTYTMCLLATNEAGIEFFSKEEVTTESAEPSDAAKAWVGTWKVKSTQMYSINYLGEGTVIDGADTFTVNITTSPNDPNEVVIDGWSVLGEGFITYGTVDGETLYILNGTYLGIGEDGSFYLYWLGWYDFGPSIDDYPSNIVTMNGNTATSTNKMTLYDENGNEDPVTCFASDVFGVDMEYSSIYFIIEEFPGVYRTGDMTWTKTSAIPSRLSKNFVKPSVLPSSVVVAM